MADFAFRLAKRDAGSLGKWKHTNYDIKQGETAVGSMSVGHHEDRPERLHVWQVEVKGGRNSVGPSDVRRMSKQLREDHPKARTVEGVRVSGARGGAMDNDEPPAYAFSRL